MVNLKTFLPRLLPNVVGCPEPLALQALLDSCIEFCHRSQVVTTTLEPVTVLAGDATYELEPPDQTTIEQVLKVWFDGQPLTPIPYEQATSISDSRGSPRYVYGQDIDEVFTLTLLPVPDTTMTKGLVARVALRPTRSATQVHDLLYERYSEAIVAGAMGILMAVPNQPFTDMGMAGAQAVRARYLAGSARIDAMRGRLTSSMSVRMRAF